MSREKLWFTVSVVGSLPVHVFFVLLLFLFDSSWFFLSFGIMLVLVTIVVYAVKWWFPTTRPNERRGLPVRRRLWNHWRFVDRSSFPSAHAAYAAGLLALSFFLGSWGLRVFLFLFLCVVSWSRLSLREHYWRDVVAGAVLGAASGWLAWWLSPFFAPFF